MGAAASINDNRRLRKLAKEYKMEYSDLVNQKKQLEKAIGGKYFTKEQLAKSLTVDATPELVDSLQRVLSGSKRKRVTCTDYLVGIFKFSYGSPKQRFDYCFQLFDYDGGGSLELEELEVIINSLMKERNGRKLTKRQRKIVTQRYFALMDADGGGDVDLAEFRRVAINDKALAKAIMNLARFYQY